MRTTPLLPRSRGEEHRLRALVDLLNLGYRYQEVCAAMKISKTTYYRWLDEIERIKAAGKGPTSSATHP